MEPPSTNQETYSREVEEILHRKPALLVRQGILFLTILIVLVIAGSSFITYPEKLAASVTFGTIAPHDSSALRGKIVLTSAAASIVKPGQPVTMLLQPSPESAPVKVMGTVAAMNPIGTGDYYIVEICPDTSCSLSGYQGTATIETGEISILSNILNPVLAVFRTADR
ncbi:MAG: hypothetical protein D4R67_02465 [Bacteroidetes bacterium]|nr:MAG: hypothetical protein D4R67_02465 [Bacteroidota bacterium]